MKSIKQINHSKDGITPRCFYCQSTHGVVQCQCGKYFCNGKIENQNLCQIFHHMKENDHYSVKINGKQLKCISCEETNIYNLKVHQWKQEVKCNYCLEKCSKQEKEEFVNNIYHEGKFMLKSFQLDQSHEKVSQQIVNIIENKISKPKTNLHVKKSYDTIKDYCRVYKQLNKLEQKEEATVLEMCFHKSSRGNQISYEEKNGKYSFTINLNKPIGGLTEDDSVIICCGGNLRMVTSEKVHGIKTQAEKLFQSSKCTIATKPINPKSKTLVLEVDDMYFADQLITSNGTTIKRYPTGNTKRWTFNKKIVDETQLFRVYFLTSEKADPLDRALKVFEERSQDQFYSKVICSNAYDYSIEPIKYSEEDLSAISIERLNEYQQKAVLNALNCELSLVIGPPGTGKTTTAIEIIRNLLYVERTKQVSSRKRRKVKGKGEREIYIQLNAEFQKIARRDNKAFLSEQYQEIEENNGMGKTRDLFKKTGDITRIFHAKMGMIKDKNSNNLTEAEDIKKRWQEHTEELYKKVLMI